MTSLDKDNIGFKRKLSLDSKSSKSSNSARSSVSVGEQKARAELLEIFGKQNYSRDQKRLKVVNDDKEERDDRFIPIREISLGGRKRRYKKKAKRKTRKRKTKKRRRKKNKRRTKKRRR
tara:strand:+ start:247 stop:603 length:357 start_codon:yes stop_codon:yes gene_type:complete